MSFWSRGEHISRRSENAVSRSAARRSATSPCTVARRRTPPPLVTVDLVIVAVKAYDNATALPLLTPMLGSGTSVLTVQNGIGSIHEVAAVTGEARVIGGTTYIASALGAPGVIEQTGTHRRVVFGEVFGALPRSSQRVAELHEALSSADIQSEAVGDGRVPIWEKFIFLVPLAGFTGASRLPIGPVWADPFTRAQFLEACREIESLARAEGVPVATDVIEKIEKYIGGIPGTMRSSLLIDLAQGKRIEVEALHGAVVGRAAAAGVPVPIISTLYAVLKLHAAGGG